jgi:hypothetical protein
LTELVASPAVAETVARIRDHLASGTPCMVLSVPAGAGKTAILNALLSEPALLSSGRSVKHDIAELDQLHSNLERCDRLVVICDPFDAYSGYPSVVPAPTASIASPADVADHPWSSMVGSPPSSQLIPIDRARYPHGLLHERQYRASFAVAIDETLLSRLRQDLLRLIDGVRAILRLMLIRVLSALSHSPDAINVALVLLASSRCFGHRTDPSDYTLPVLTSMSVVTGRLPACVS